MITKKTYPNHHVFETEIGGRTLTVETGKVAELANAECICRYGDTVVLTTITASPLPKAGIDYFPLTIEFEERLYGVGRIPGSFNRREGRPSEKAILTMRLIDRPMRPFFDDELRNDVVITCTAFATDHDNPVEVVASLGAFIVTACSDVPWNGPMATTEVALVDGEYVINPSADQRAAAKMFCTIASTAEKVVMIETEANEVSEEDLLKGIELAHETNKKIVEFINSIVAVIGKPKFTFEKAAVNHDMLDDLEAYGMDKIEYALDTDDKNVREERLTAAVIDFKEKFGEKYEDFDIQIDVCLYKMQKKVVKKWLLAGKRVDGRGMDEIRPLGAEVGVLPRVHGTGLFTRGQTQVLSICTLATLSMEQKLDTIFPEESKRYIHHYNFPAFSTGEARGARSTSRREIGHGALAEKALVPVLPSVDEFPYCIRVVSEVLSSNGSTSQGSICGSTLALMDAGVPIRRPVAGISCGLISDKETGEWRTFTDIQGVEDFHGEMDFKVAGTTEGITAIQMDLKVHGLTPAIIKEALEKTYKARLYILDEIMLKAIPEVR
ncbi:MAG: polyribonucleotide nucleotidyltransferase, partial [Oscillospiraceae bacterium]|nr:polyribonucleotide nucleotidyltransferase [Oscillospiraceae bacterium]